MPKNGTQHLDSLRDGREIFINGKLVEDVTTHPAVPQFDPVDGVAL